MIVNELVQEWLDKAEEDFNFASTKQMMEQEISKIALNCGNA